ncbi:F-box domain containing protein [Pandoravirus quercus]|nr:F-box domain containing protein [Pandoravirus quercus]AVK74747.1 F-box domain containing protein [Pandoravirus quercus]
MTTIMDLPDEALVALALQIDDVANVLAFGATCARFAAIIRDDHLWMSLFARDHGRVYAQGLFAIPWAPDAGPHDEWSYRATRFWREMMETYEPTTDIDPHPGTLGPHTPTDGRAPPPFARMVAAGKTWRWLYACHAREPTPTRDSNEPSLPTTPVATTLALSTITRPGAVLVSRTMGATRATTATKIFRGDVSPHGLANGYGVEIRWRQGCAIGWTEGLWRDGQAYGWHVVVSRASATSGFMRRGRLYGVACVTARDGRRTWGKIENRAMVGPCLSEYVNGAWLRGIMKGGIVVRATKWLASGVRIGWTTDDANATVADDGGDWLERYPNGDAVLFRGTDTDHLTVVWFRCSPTSPHREFADRVIRDVHWSLICMDEETADRQWIFVPQNDSEDARAFWRYVHLDDGISWSDEARRIAIDIKRAHAPLVVTAP